MGVCFVDTETTSLHPEYGEVYEAGLITPDNDFHWWLPVTLEHADEMALKVGRFHERHPRGNGHGPGAKERTTSLDSFARTFARLTHGQHLAGAVVSFDALRLDRLLRSQGVLPSWSYHLIDVEALAAGWVMGREDGGETHAQPPWDSHELSRALGVNPDDFDRHTALGDAAWGRAVYKAVMG